MNGVGLPPEAVKLIEPFASPAQVAATVVADKDGAEHVGAFKTPLANVEV